MPSFAGGGDGHQIDDRPDLVDALYIDTILKINNGSHKFGDNEEDANEYLKYCCPASPTTVPAKTSRSNSSDSPVRPLTPSQRPITPQRPRRQRTTSMNQTTTAHPSGSIIRSNNRTIYTAGRPPWYNCAGQQVEPFVIGICGGSASGKTTVAQKIIESLDVPWVTLLSMDCFYKDLSTAKAMKSNLFCSNCEIPVKFKQFPGSQLILCNHCKIIANKSQTISISNATKFNKEPDLIGNHSKNKKNGYKNYKNSQVLNEKQHDQAIENEYNFDHPDAFDIDLLIDVLKKLKEGRKVEVPVYNFVTHSRENHTKTMYGANVIIFEGILVFHNPEVLKLLDMKVFVDTDADIRLARRLKRDISQRGRDLEGVLKQYSTMVKPSYANYIAPSMIHADIIVPRGGENKVAIHLIVQHVHTQLQLRGFKLRETLAHSYIGQPMPDSLNLLPSTPQIKGLHTFIRNKNTSRDEFIFYSKRLIRLVIEYALSLFPFKDTTVETPQGVQYQGKRLACKKICGVSILRAGETMEQAVCDVLKNIRIGKILIQTNHTTGEPELYYLRLPKDIKDYQVILMDATVATGAAALMAIRVLLDHDVQESNIILVSLLMAEIGVHSIAYAFPKVKIVSSALDPEINDKFYVIPGIGNFGDRYFGTEPSETEIFYDDRSIDFKNV
ncbi:uridine-cytidine kinase-like 1 isoform X2 [Condylostylus longicornis]|uniref:uridine-cytidine kinase-like 1 isoform X2 n=1 Tax=Condylostylus longicornis TaxID=2530218 RepID=UPI00244E3D1A|nr:uridine-cytidine kinase-like 1 isoform X2 [Condylostylus longicornis]